MRFLLLLSIASMGYAMEDYQPPVQEDPQPINNVRDETVPLLNVELRRRTMRDAVNHCTDHHFGKVLLCGYCIGAGLVGTACWYAGCVEGFKASYAIVDGVMQ